MSSDQIRVLFVCLGNICRSPLGENVLRHLAAEEGLGDRLEVDSAGTSAYHIGEPPDGRTAEVARARGLRLTGSARQIEPEDLARFDYILAMDRSNSAAVTRLAERVGGAADVHLLREFDPDAEPGSDLDVPDPYFGGPRGFEDVHDLVERSCRGLLEHIRRRHGL